MYTSLNVLRNNRIKEKDIGSVIMNMSIALASNNFFADNEDPKSRYWFIRIIFGEKVTLDFSNRDIVSFSATAINQLHGRKEITGRFYYGRMLEKGPYGGDYEPGNVFFEE